MSILPPASSLIALSPEASPAPKRIVQKKRKNQDEVVILQNSQEASLRNFDMDKKIPKISVYGCVCISCR